MSIWTHVAGVIRIDSFRFGNDVPDFDALVGKECLWDNNRTVWDEQAANPDKFLPMGSEGSLQKSVWVNPKANHLAAYTVTIFGDLRSFSRPNEIVEWFKKKCNEIDKEFMIRQAVITVETEFIETITWTYEEEQEK